jgi:lipopolysaccharide export system protein LptA
MQLISLNKNSSVFIFNTLDNMFVRAKSRKIYSDFAQYGSLYSLLIKLAFNLNRFLKFDFKTVFNFYLINQLMNSRLLLLLFVFSCLTFNAQQAGKMIDFSANKIKYAKNLGAQILVGNVVFKHEGAVITCDSACRYDNNTVRAFNHIIIQKGDSLQITGDLLKYDGNTKLAELEGNVICSDAGMILKTPSLNYQVNNSVASYLNGGVVISKSSTLTSKKGIYQSGKKLFNFYDDVTVVHPDFKLTSNTIDYHTPSHTVSIFGPTHLTNGKNKMYAENGWYNTETQNCQLNSNAIIYYDKTELHADSIYYDKFSGYGLAKKNVKIIDTLNKSQVHGNKAEYFEKEGRSVVTKNAVMIKKMDKDSVLLFADTLITKRLNKNQKLNDSSTFRALHHVTFFKASFSGISDSMFFNSSDSLFTIYNKPLFWSDSAQFTSQFIQIKLGPKGIKKIDLTGNAFMIMQEEKDKFNQVKGKNMYVQFYKDTISRIDIDKDAQVSYYLKNEKKKLTALNKSSSKDASIYFEKGELQKITFKDKPTSKLIPIKNVVSENELLKGFTWSPQKKPILKVD